MCSRDGFHPDLTTTSADDHTSPHTRVHHVKASALSSATAQTSGMQRFAAIFVRSGNPEFVFHDGVQEVRIATAPGDYIFGPPYVPHREENPDHNNPAVIVIARSTQEAVVVNLPELYALSETSE